jgi:Lar family restriction alleviation protein
MVKTQTPVNEPCPFCGDRCAKIDTLNYTSGKPGRFRVQCQDCGGATKWHSTEEDAWKAWNNRFVKLSLELEVFIFNSDAFAYKGRLYIRDRPSLYCFAQKEFRGPLKRIKKSDFLSAYQEATIVQAERTNTECEKTVRQVKK